MAVWQTLIKNKTPIARNKQEEGERQTRRARRKGNRKRCGGGGWGETTKARGERGRWRLVHFKGETLGGVSESLRFGGGRIGLVGAVLLGEGARGRLGVHLERDDKVSGEKPSPVEIGSRRSRTGARQGRVSRSGRGRSADPSEPGGGGGGGGGPPGAQAGCGQEEGPFRSAPEGN